MSKPLSEAEKKLLAQFVAGMVQGTVSLGFTSLGMVDLYKRAQENRQSIIEVLTSDATVCLELANACKKGVARLPPTVLTVLKQIIEEAQELQEEQKSRHPVSPDGGSPDDP